MNSVYQKKKEEIPGSDEKIKIDACDALALVPDLNCSEIKVTVDKGTLTLRGAVEEARLKQMAEESIQHVFGLKQVQNELRIGGHQHAKSTHLRQSQRLLPQEKHRMGRSK